jgi:protein TonB
MRQNHVVIDLIDVPPSPKKKDPAALPKPSPPPAPKVPAKAPQPVPPPAPSQREMPDAEELPAKKAEPENPAASSPLPGGGDAQSMPGGAPGKGSGIENFPGGGDVAVLPGPGLGKSGTGRGESPPGPGTGEKGSRPAKPIQTAKASYPPLALRMGLEADVTLRVFIDTEGRVTKAQVTKSAGGGFDDEALKAVKQFRFEPAISEGQRVSSEFTYVYRFRIER